MPLTALHHVQVARPAGSEHDLRAFYGGVLGMSEVPKPAVLAARGGVWFRSGGAEIHCGVEAEFRPARKARANAPCQRSGEGARVARATEDESCIPETSFCATKTVRSGWGAAKLPSVHHYRTLKNTCQGVGVA